MSPESPNDPVPERDIAIHIFTASAALVGVCLTVISIVRSLSENRSINALVDDLLAIDAMVFLGSCLFSYFALRSRGKRKTHRLETAADSVFLIGLFGLVAACAMIVWAVV
jgi:hypothetical protein